MGIGAAIKNLIGRKQGAPNIYPAFSYPWEETQGKMRPGDYSQMVGYYHSWVFACVSAIAKPAAAVPFGLYVLKGKDWAEVEDHPLLDLLVKVNPFMNGLELMELTHTYLELTGNCYWHSVKNRLGTPAELWILPSQYMKVVPSRAEFIKGYLFKMGTSEVAFEADEIIHFKYPHPGSIYYGLGPLEAARYAADSNQYQKDYEQALFKNRARPDGVLETDQELDDPDAKRLEKRWYQLFRGVSRAGKIAILSMGAKYKPIAMSPQDLAFIEGRKLTREEICGIFKVPAAKLGIVTDVNRANADALDYTFSKDVILPKLRLMEAKLNETLTPRFDDRLWFEFESPVPEDKEYVLKERESNLKTGYSSINEEREKVGDEPAPWGDVPYIPINLIPVTAPPAPQRGIEWGCGKNSKLKLAAKDERRDRRRQIYSAAVEPHERALAETMKQIFAGQERQVLANLRKLPKHLTPPHPGPLRGRRGRQGEVNQRAEKALIDLIIFAPTVEEEKTAAAVKPHMAGMVDAGAQVGADALGIEVAFDASNPRVAQWLAHNAYRAAKDITDATVRHLRRSLAQGEAAGETIEEMAGRVQAVFGFASGHRSLRIAQTETLTASNYGEHQAWVESGVVSGKEWLHGGAGYISGPREWHEAMDGERVGLNEAFSNGLMYPGDPNGSPEEIIFCRCSMLPVVAE